VRPESKTCVSYFLGGRVCINVGRERDSSKLMITKGRTKRRIEQADHASHSGIQFSAVLQ
jgi:hypothetical protein